MTTTAKTELPYYDSTILLKVLQDLLNDYCAENDAQIEFVRYKEQSKTYQAKLTDKKTKAPLFMHNITGGLILLGKGYLFPTIEVEFQKRIAAATAEQTEEGKVEIPESVGMSNTMIVEKLTLLYKERLPDYSDTEINKRVFELSDMAKNKPRKFVSRYIGLIGYLSYEMFGFRLGKDELEELIVSKRKNALMAIIAKNTYAVVDDVEVTLNALYHAKPHKLPEMLKSTTSADILREYIRQIYINGVWGVAAILKRRDELRAARMRRSMEKATTFELNSLAAHFNG